MKRSLMVMVLVGLVTSLVISPAPVQAQDSTPNNSGEAYNGEVLCLPGVYLVDPGNCLPLGPSTYITELARKGVTYPATPLPIVHPDPSLNAVSLNYAKINIADEEAAALYSTLEDAMAGTNPTAYIAAGFGLRYVTYIQRSDVNGGHYIQLPNGHWLRASPAAVSSVFQGLLFTSNPRTSFGWIIDPTEPVASPTFAAPVTGQTLIREQVVEIYDVQEAEGTTWYMVGANQWVHRQDLRMFQLNPTPPEGVTNGRWIEVNLYEQTLAVYEEGQLRFATLVATGAEPYFTRPGLFQIYEKKELETMEGAFEADRSDYYHLADVPWTMYFDKARALHGAYWRAYFGLEQSHGCVNLSIGDSRWIFDWAQVGDWVYVWDPSGRTPTDPSFYGEGGA
jgi:lipoprotein-anchoring transpeptidase ErfK/SrfK